MTLMNSAYRRPKTKRPQPFDYEFMMLSSDRLVCQDVSMGSYDAPKVHLCQMGSWDTDGVAYVNCGSAPLFQELV